MPSCHGEYYRRVMSLSYQYGQWVCEDMIVAYWTDMSELPEEIVL